MKIIHSISSSFLTFFGLPLIAWAADPITAGNPTSVDSLVEVLPTLQAKYVDFASLNYKPGDHLADLIARSGGRISIAPSVTTPVPIVTGTVDAGILYWELASFVPPTGKSWADLFAQIPTLGPNGLILDLRSNTTPDDYAGASKLLARLKPAPPSPAGGSTNAARSTPLLPSVPIVILTNGSTSGAAEALAGYLQADGALVIGRRTAGQVAAMAQAQLSSGQILRYAVAASGNDDPSTVFRFRSEVPIWNKPVVPDITVTVEDQSEKAALILVRSGHLLDVVGESPLRHRMSEASLVQGQDPEWDDYLSSLEQRPVLLSLPIVHDTALISALDSLKAIHLSQRAPPALPAADGANAGAGSVQ